MTNGTVAQATLGAKRGRRAAEELLLMVDRPLEPGDMAALAAAGGAPASGAPVIARLRSAHHQAAQLMATGLPQVEIGRITGFSQSRLSILKTDPAFADLVNHYATVKEFKFADAMERMAALGLTSLEELQERMESEPENFSSQMLLEITELMLVKAKVASAKLAPPLGAQGFAIQVQFVAPEGPLIDGQAEDVPPRLVSNRSGD